MDHRLNALLEVGVIFFLILLSGMLVNILCNYLRFGIFGHNTYTIIAYMVDAAIILGFMVAAGRSFSGYGISLRNLGSDLKVVAICAIPVNAALLAGILLPLPRMGFTEGQILEFIIDMAMLLVIAKLLANVFNKEDKVYHGNKVILGLLVFILAMLLQSVSSFALSDTSPVYSFFICFVLVGPVEEILYRGYMQSRLNEAFGRPYGFFGVSWGAGIVITTLIFGLAHVFNYGFNPFMGNYNLDWAWGLVVIPFGLTMGFIREKTGGIAAPAMLHASANFIPMLSRFLF